LRQVDVAKMARLSPSAISRHEGGRFNSIRRLRRHAESVDLRLDLRLLGRGGELERLADDEHAAIVETVARLMRQEEYELAAELTFNERGERGRYDLFACERRSESAMVVEVKGELTGLESMLGSMDVKLRLAATVAGRLGWPIRRRKLVLVVAATSRNRHIVAAHHSTFASFEQHQLGRRWLRPPAPDRLLLWVTPACAGRQRWIAGRRRVQSPSAAQGRPRGS
jgi:hypothetical protein